MTIGSGWVLVTGGASGLGAACVRALLDAGAKVAAIDLSAPDDTDGVSYEAGWLPLVADVVDPAAVQAAIEAGRARFGALRGVIHCAGILKAERLLTRQGPASLEDFRRVVEVNLVGTFNVARLTAAAMQGNPPETDGERGVIVLTSSVAAEDGQIGQASYAASKGGVAAMTLPLARELGSVGIRVVSIAPGAFETPMLAAAPDRVRDSLIAQTPFPPRLGKDEEFARLALHVFENVMLNGCMLRLDGGLRMGPR